IFSMNACTGQNELNNEMAIYFAQSIFEDNRRMEANRSVNFILDEANQPSLKAYQEMAKNGYIKMNFIASNSKSAQYAVTMLAPSQEFLADSLNQLYQTIVYDSLHIAGIEQMENCYKISYHVLNMRPTPLNRHYYYKPERFTHKRLEAVCFACLVDDAWEVYRNEQYKNRGRWHFQVHLNKQD
ncbi:MAG: hypothetical protein AB8E82_03965, partial [Aureispira sp.]